MDRVTVPTTVGSALGGWWWWLWWWQLKVLSRRALEVALGEGVLEALDRVTTPLQRWLFWASAARLAAIAPQSLRLV